MPVLLILGTIVAPVLIAIGIILVLTMGIYLILPPCMKGDPDPSKTILFVVGIIALILGIVFYSSYKKTQENMPIIPVDSGYKVYLELEMAEINPLIYDITLIDDEEKTVYIKTK